MNLPFLKMHGLGNDFVVVDARHNDVQISLELIRRIGDRRCGVGFDQLAIIRCIDSKMHLSFFNQDGSSSMTCGNATRCIAHYLMNEAGQSRLQLFTPRGVLETRAAADGLTSVNLGHPETGWSQIPLAKNVDTCHLPIDGDPIATGMGNPHCTFFVDNIDTIELERIGSYHERHPLFPEHTNVQVAQVLSRDHIRVRVWERGVGVTPASGSSASAVTVAAVRRDHCAKNVRVDLDGGTIWVEWSDDGVWSTGPTAHVFSGVLTAAFLGETA